jgi:hypothetical protein
MRILSRAGRQTREENIGIAKKGTRKCSKSQRSISGEEGVHRRTLILHTIIAQRSPTMT